MNRKLTQEDKTYLASISKGRAYSLGHSLLAYGIRGEVFDYIMQGSASLDYNNQKQRLEWVTQAMKRMEEKLPPELIKEMRESSACCLGGERAKLAKKIHDSFDTVEQRFEALSREHYIIGNKAERVGPDTYRVSFFDGPPEGGYCCCLKYVPKEEPVPVSWCMCCAGHIKTHFEHALGVKAECRCVSSQLSSCGKENCVFELIVIGNA